LFGQATLKRIDPSPGALPLHRARPGLQSYTAEIGPFASIEDAAAVCRALEAADIQCRGH
jgi:hypothetical protein